ncbi:hypothetical protein KFL_001540240 [Klebsormidium nitens]|uniref:Uncharacterized protein n=1 Tax=Klebsormidium nitens TaxID=105231 RepID=A0A1Y1I4F4_KLENI|nr:hypothetical protein KFL_001540240 [Klebsormidium nitens]|eukprot:GAQ83606.1 hypothetical protein KFL_001540240 [Klebsormidium nitens]
MAVPVTLFLVLFVPALLIFFTCLMSCFMMLTPNRLSHFGNRQKPSARHKPPLSLSIGAGGAVESDLDGPRGPEAGLNKGVDVRVNIEPNGELLADERSSIMSAGVLLSDGNRAGTPGGASDGEGQRTPKAKVKMPRGSGRSSPRFLDLGPGGGLARATSAPVPELEIVDLLLLESVSTEGGGERTV